MLKIVPKDFECLVCLGDFAPKDDANPTVMIESCGEYLHKECLERQVLINFNDAIGNFFSNTGNFISKFHSLQRRYLTPNQHFSIKEIVYNHSIDEVWKELGTKEFIEKEGFRSSYEYFAPAGLRDYFRYENPGNLSLDEIRSKLGASRDPVYGTAEWDIVHWTTFGVRLIYNFAVALIVDVGLEATIWVSDNLFDSKHVRENTQNFREGNVSHRFTHLFKEYWGMTYNPELKDSFETKAWKWIRARTI
ncbi:hypothetical protein [Candidatus Neptunichlamydia sp. REUL1]|uniref:hypothetical protein n=1 Tax=Candidatus Neptunichlamydia sp. REUL1 TaxID=3064277 RepID=UPI00292EBF52|nr:hypothetical protein [Candidatus Neptunochlamydia sp. REUL1]